MKKYNIWSEGFSCTGSDSDATFYGTVEANSFREACYIVMCKKYLKEVEKSQNSVGYYDPDRFDFNPVRLTDWGCALYDNEADARKSFG